MDEERATNGWDVLNNLINKWNIWYTIILSIVILLFLGTIGAETVTHWIQAVKIKGVTC